MLLLLPPPWPARAPSAARAGRSPLRAPPACSALGGSALTAKPGASVEADASSPPASSPPPGCAAPPAEAAAAKRPIKLQLSQPRASPNKRLGQHFLQSLAVVDAAVAAAGVRPGDAVLEVGPGTGVLTRALLKAGASVVALEKDAALASLLADNNRALTASGRLTVVRDDALRWLRSPAFGAAFPAGRAGGAKVVANIPYAVTTELLSLLLPCGDRLASATLLVQEELAQRLFVQGPGVGQEAREMSLRVRFHAQPHYVRPVLRACFAPPPGVDSALVRLDLLPPEKWALPPHRVGPFFEFVRLAFGARRKMLRNTLAGGAAAVEAALAAACAHPEARPQALTLPQFLLLYEALHPAGAGAGPQSGGATDGATY